MNIFLPIRLLIIHANRFMQALYAIIIGGIYSQTKKVNICMHNIVLRPQGSFKKGNRKKRFCYIAPQSHQRLRWPGIPCSHKAKASGHAEAGGPPNRQKNIVGIQSFGSPGGPARWQRSWLLPLLQFWWSVNIKKQYNSTPFPHLQVRYLWEKKLYSENIILAPVGICTSVQKFINSECQLLSLRPAIKATNMTPLDQRR